MFCTECGKELPDGSLFCTNCGTRLKPAGASGDLPKAEELEKNINANMDNVMEQAGAAAGFEEAPKKPAYKPRPARDDFAYDRPAPKAAARKGINTIAMIITILGGAVLIASTVLPFMEIWTFNGTNLFDEGYGIFFATIGILGILAAVLNDKIFAFLNGLAAVVFTVWLILCANFIFSDADFKIGFYLMIAGAAVMFIGGILALVLKKK